MDQRFREKVVQRFGQKVWAKGLGRRFRPKDWGEGLGTRFEKDSLEGLRAKMSQSCLLEAFFTRVWSTCPI